MTQTIDAHFDGRVIVPDEPVSLATAQRVRVTIQPIDPAWTPERLEAQKRAVDRLLARPKPQVDIPDEAFRRENLYED